MEAILEHGVKGRHGIRSVKNNMGINDPGAVGSPRKQVVPSTSGPDSQKEESGERETDGRKQISLRLPQGQNSRMGLKLAEVGGCLLPRILGRRQQVGGMEEGSASACSSSIL